MTLPPNRFGYWPITERPKLEWPGGARVAFWVAPNIEHYEYTLQSRPGRPDIPDYALKDYGNRVGFWRMYNVLAKYGVRATTCLNLTTLDHFPEVRDAMVAADWAYMAHGVYNTWPIYGYTVEEERAYWNDFIETVERKTGKRVKGRLGGGGGYMENTDDLMAEAGCLYHTSWIIDDKPIPITVKGGQPFCYVPDTGQTNDAGVLAIPGGRLPLRDGAAPVRHTLPRGGRKRTGDVPVAAPLPDRPSRRGGLSRPGPRLCARPRRSVAHHG